MHEKISDIDLRSAKSGRTPLVAERAQTIVKAQATGHRDAALIGNHPENKAILAVLEKLAITPDRGEIAARIGASGNPVYDHDPAFPGLVVRIEADGTRTLGRFENRRFVPVVTDTAEPDPA